MKDSVHPNPIIKTEAETIQGNDVPLDEFLQSQEGSPSQHHDKNGHLATFGSRTYRIARTEHTRSSDNKMVLLLVLIIGMPDQDSFFGSLLQFQMISSNYNQDHRAIEL